ncbi:beta-glucoside-specific PTS transporter subunit IIABC [Lacticaseibacillus absianus]|uniref:beta-glucoside-specific PTS transporter subunit IIABC n=1 Tax=Lacticaseibacillus absianus TaxID=2729623 RepID=UPI0015CEE1FB|nr:beta-glucoside-specific PTS transporter subunit IIABC [Lacticaseibacillus absianus]
MTKYDQLATDIIARVGGRENILGLTHCVTRLRFKLKDERLADTDALKAMAGVVTVMQSAGQYQVVIGNHVPDVYAEVVRVGGIETGTGGDAPKKMKFGDRVIDLISGIMMPALAVMCAGGMIKGLAVILMITGALTDKSGAYILLNAIGDATFYFFPVVIGFNAAKKFNMTPFLGLIIGAALLHPTVNGVDLNFWGMNFNASYSSTILPVILMVALAAPLERWLKRVIPDVIKTFVVPMLTLLVIVPLGFMLIGPAANLVSLVLTQGIEALMSFSPILAGLVLGATWQLLVMFGVHMMLIVMAMIPLAAGQPTALLTPIMWVSFAQTAVVIAIWLKSRDKKLKGIALPAWISGIFGVTEPAIYGVTLPRMKMFVLSCIGGGLAGALSSGLGLVTYRMGGMGIFAIPGMLSTENASRDLMFAGLCLATAMIPTFIAAYVMYQDDPVTNAIEDAALPGGSRLERDTVLTSPMTGQLVPLRDVQDGAFAGGALGEGIAIDPTDGRVVAPADATVMTVFPTKHAIGLITDTGAEVLLHLGMDTVQLGGEHFDVAVEAGQHVQAGDLLATLDLAAIRAAGYAMVTPMVVTNTGDYLDVIAELTNDATITAGAPLLTLIANTQDAMEVSAHAVSE